jgi:hypothetical protein
MVYRKFIEGHIYSSGGCIRLITGASEHKVSYREIIGPNIFTSEYIINNIGVHKDLTYTKPYLKYKTHGI